MIIKLKGKSLSTDRQFTCHQTDAAAIEYSFWIETMVRGLRATVWSSCTLKHAGDTQW